MKKLLILQALFIILASDVLCYETNVHEKITTQAINQSNIRNYLSERLSIPFNDEFNGKKVIEWLKLGSKWEDDGVRWMNHFYDPITGKGLNNWGILLGEPSLEWAKSSINNAYDWNRARIFYYSALTNTSLNERKAAFAYVFRSLGQVIHLAQDLAVPSHVRNDAHPPLNYDYYEKYTSGKSGSLTYTGYPAVDIATFNSFDKFWINNGSGLSEYTNANFFSRDTIFKNYSSPSRENTNFDDFDTLPTMLIRTPDNIEHNTFYITGYGKKHLAGLKYLSEDLFKLVPLPIPMQIYRLSLTLDDRCHEEYAKDLIPRAVGYSAGLLNYFFRGDIDLIPNYGSETEKGYLIKNNTNEDMEGTFEIWYDDKEGKRKYLWSSLLEIKKHDKSPNIDLQFPADSIDKCKYILVFKGKMGAEEGAVIGKIIDLSKDDYSAECMACSRAKIEQEMAQYTIDEQLIASSTKTAPIHKPTGSSSSESGGNIGCSEYEEHHSFYIRKTEPDQNCLNQCYSNPYGNCENCYYEGINYNPAGKSDQQYAYDVGGVWGPKPLNTCGFDNKQQVVKCTPARQVDGTYLIATWRQAEYTNGKVNYYSGTGKFGPLSTTSEYSDCTSFKAWIRESFDLNWTVQTTTNYSVSPETYVINNGDYEAMYLTSIEPDGNGKIATLTYWKTRIEEIPTYTYNITVSSSTTFTNKDESKTDTKTFSDTREHKNTSSYGYLLETHTKKYRCEDDVFTEIE